MIPSQKNQIRVSFKFHGSLLMSLLALVLIAGCGKKSGNSNEDDSSVTAESRGSNIHEYQYSELHKLNDFELTERDGTQLGLNDLRGKVWIASFFFSSCKSECSDQNRTIRDEVHEKLAGVDFTVVSVSVDPESDTPEVLQRYATEFTTSPEKWKFLTGEIGDVQKFGDENFKVIVEPSNHSKRLLLVDKWGTFRDSFEWKEPSELKRLLKTAKMLVAEEQEPEPDEIIKTRAMPESVFQLNNQQPSQKEQESTTQSKRDPNWPAWRNEEWLTSFQLTDRHGKTFDSTEMLGKVWVANFFFSSCTGACPKLLSSIEELRTQIGDRDVTFVSISNDPDRDTPQVLKEYSQKFKADADWKFLTGQEHLQIRAIGSEFFNVNAGGGETHSEQLTVIDKWGKVRGHFAYDKAEEMTKMRLLLDDLIAEQEPPKKK